MKNFILCIFFIQALLLTACEKNKQDEAVIATINNSRISLEDIQKEISLYSKRQPLTEITSQTVEDHLNTMIEKQLMIQEATKLGLAEDEKFVETIKTFWEQTLIRELINSKNIEWGKRLFVSENEIQQQYSRMQYRPSVKVVKAKTRELAENYKMTMLKKENIKDEQIIDPLFYEDLKLGVLQNAFDMNIGEVKFFNNDDEYVVIYLIKKEKTTLPPLKNVYDRIKGSILEQKQQKALEEWIGSVKKSADIFINTKLLMELSHEK